MRAISPLKTVVGRIFMMQMINPVISGTAFSADTATGCRGTDRRDLVSIDASYGLGEAVVGGKVTPDKLYVFQRDDGGEVVIRQMGCKDMTKLFALPCTTQSRYRRHRSLFRIPQQCQRDHIIKILSVASLCWRSGIAARQRRQHHVFLCAERALNNIAIRACGCSGKWA